MTLMSYVVITLLWASFIVLAIATTANRNIGKGLAKDMLRGSIQNEGKNLLRVLQRNVGSDGVAVFTPLKHFCNLVCYYKHLGGSFEDLNEHIATISSTLASKEQPIPAVIFSMNPDTTPTAFIEVGKLGRKYIFNLHHTDSLDVEASGTGIG